MSQQRGRGVAVHRAAVGPGPSRSPAQRRREAHDTPMMVALGGLGLACGLPVFSEAMGLHPLLTLGLGIAGIIAWALAVRAVAPGGKGRGPDGRPMLRTRFSDGRGSIPEPGGPPGDWLRLRELPLGVRRDLTAPGRARLVARVLGMDHEFVADPAGGLQELYLLIDLAVRTREPTPLDLVVRIVGPGGEYLQAGLSPHRGYRGRFRFLHRLPYVNGTVSHYGELEVHVPLGGVPLPREIAAAPLRAEVDLVAAGQTERLARVERRFRRPPMSSHRLPEAVEPLGEGELVILATAAPAELGAGECPVCGGDLGSGQPERCCPECDTPHHLDCWRFAHGCSTFGCTGGRVM